MKITISVPDDVGAILKQLPAGQVSAYITEALKRRQVTDLVQEALHAAGHRHYDHDPEGARARVAAARVPDAIVQEARQRLMQQMPGVPAPEWDRLWNAA